MKHARIAAAAALGMALSVVVTQPCLAERWISMDPHGEFWVDLDSRQTQGALTYYTAGETKTTGVSPGVAGFFTWPSHEAVNCGARRHLQQDSTTNNWKDDTSEWDPEPLARELAAICD
jgi:hypothetical protein